MAVKKDALLALALIAFNAVYVSQLFKMPFPFAQGEPGPAFVPILLAALLFVASIAILIGELKADGEEEAGAVAFLRPALVVVSTGAFIALLYYFGYWVAAPVYAFCVAMTFEFSDKDRLVRALGFSVAISATLTVFGFLFFEKLFELSLPTGVY